MTEIDATSLGDDSMNSFTKAELKEYKERLLALRARLRGDVSQMADAAPQPRSAHGVHDVQNR